MARFRMKRIDPPAEAREGDVWLECMHLADYQAIQQHHNKMLEVVHKEVEKYLNTRDLVYDDDEGFPNRSRMTGEYYVGRESYIGNNEGGYNPGKEDDHSGPAAYWTQGC